MSTNFFTKIQDGTIRSLCVFMMIFAIGLLSEVMGQTNLIGNNPGFEVDIAEPDGKPDFYNYRHLTENCHGLETNTDNVYSQTRSALFDNDATSDACYYVARYNDSGTIRDFLNVETGEEYELSIKYKTENPKNFNNEGGMYLQLPLQSGDSIHYPVSYFLTPTYVSDNSWETIKLRGTIRGSINKITGIIYYKGKGKGWADDFSLIKIKDPLCRNGSFEMSDLSSLTEPYRWFTSNGTKKVTGFENAYLGNAAALLEYSGSDPHLRGPYDTNGNLDCISVCPGDTYKITAFGRVDTTGNLLLALQFRSDNLSLKEERRSPYYSSTAWKKMTTTTLENKDIVVPSGTSCMSYLIKYEGQDQAWVDEVAVERVNLVVNSSFETDVPNPDKPDYWWTRPMTAAYHHVETDSDNVFEGNRSALFNNTGDISADCGFYGPASTGSGVPEKMYVVEGEKYSISAWVKVASNFDGNGVRVRLAFYNNAGYMDKNDIVSTYHNAEKWNKISAEGLVPVGAKKMVYVVEYKGINKAWVDTVEVLKTDSPWYYKEASIDSLEKIPLNTVPEKLSEDNMIEAFQKFHDDMEKYYNDDKSEDDLGSWGENPMIRCSANMAMGYIHASKKISDPVFLDRARAALEWLLRKQLLDGSFNNALYPSGIAGAALIDGYREFGEYKYKSASNRICDWLKRKDASSNSNYNAFAIWALMSNYKETGEPKYLERAMYFADCMLTGQLDSGMWADEHNQYIWYHGIITRALVALVDGMPSLHSKRVVYQHALYKALNHIQRNQIYTSGQERCHPFKCVYYPDNRYYVSHIASAVSMAYKWLGMKEGLKDSIATISNGANFFMPNDLQGYSLEAVGTLLDLAYD